VTRSPEQLQQQVGEIGHAYEALERIVAGGQATGEFRTDLDAKIAATVFYGALEETLTGWVMGQLPDADADIEQAEQNVADLLCRGLVRS
jgi:hypothetical protein